ncbi:3-hydroxyacyl-CoA dehydrogenase family protein [Nakamurella lactea]|uniref:3-hydroxyacyl-CoA dehydrogenase family protein n=1 Tax=Nakamurella lactea TaxID=459515 RepID=UPI000406CCD4|nr:3-hydroxyacyl-CoA dehydrogenase family protein [Nakamurella lactea]
MTASTESGLTDRRGADFGSVGVVGGGTMGSGIVHVLLAAGLAVVLVESDDDALARADRLLRASLDGAARRGKLTGTAESLLERLTATTDRNALAGCTLVVEAVPEIPELKTSLLGAIESVIAETAVLASNTSSLSLTGLGAQLRRPGRFVGMHFFNPVPAQALLEIVRTGVTEADALQRVHTLAGLIGKQTIEISDSPGFATSRLGVLLGLEAIRMVEEGVASPQDIDTAMELGYRHPMGPCRLGDLVGHDVRLGIAEYLAEQLGPRFEPPALLRQMVADGRLGKKSGQGFYIWE